MKNRLALLCLLSILNFQFSISSTYFCSPSGNGSGSSYGDACSFSNGLKKLKSAGDTLYLLGGQYDLKNTQISNLSGTSTRNIVISGYPGETAILDFRTTTYGTRGLQVNSGCTYLHIKDLTLRYSGKNNLYNEGSHCTFERLDIYGSADTGCQMKNGGNNLIKNVDSHDNFDYEHKNSSGQADFGGNADGFADKQFTGAGNHYIGCRSWNNSDDGWDFFQRVSNSETIIENCICYLNGPAEYDMRNHPRYSVDKAWFDAINGTTITNRYDQQQVVSLQHYPNHGNGNGFKLGGYYTNHLVLIHHCLAVANTVRGIDQNNNDGTMRVFNNTSYANGYNYGFTTAYGTLSIRNNVSLQGQNADATQSQTTLLNDHNTWNTQGVSCTKADFLSLDTTQILLPRLADGSLRLFSSTATSGNSLMHLASGSDLIDAGVDVGLTFMGSAPDLGCFETDGIIRPSLAITSGPEEQTVTAGDSITPVVFTWGGTDNKPTSKKPSGISSKVSNANKTITFSGAILTPGTYTISVTTTADSLNVTASATIRVRPAGLRRVAYVTTPGSAEDEAILSHLAVSDSIVITETSAADNSVDYSSFDAIVIGPKPSSTAAGFTPLKGYNKPMLVLKPFLFKASVWNWGNSVNTQDLSIHVADTTHPIFSGLTFDANQTLQLFSSCSTNAVTAISTWTNTSVTALASPVSQPTYTTIADLPAGTVCNGTTLTRRLVMLGVSEYSTAQLTDAGLQLIENAIYYLLGLPAPRHDTTALSTADDLPSTACKRIRNGRIVILRDGIEYDLMGRPL